MKKAVLYARVSTPDQHVESQLYDLRRLAAQRGFEVVGEYTDNGVSGTKARRLGLNALMTDARKRQFSVVLISAFARAARSTRHLLQLIDELDSFGILDPHRVASPTRGTEGERMKTCGLSQKLHPVRFTAMSGRMAAILGRILDERFTEPQLVSLIVTSDGFVLGRRAGDIGYNDFIGAESDLKRNWGNLLAVAGLSDEERDEARRLYSLNVTKASAHVCRGSGQN
jgi:hypothetical protein